jgi:hypothetical protein
MKSFNEFESTEETISVQEQRLALIEQSLEENKLLSIIGGYAKGVFKGSKGYQQARRAGMARNSPQAQAMMRGARRRGRELSGKGVAGQIGSGALYMTGANLASQMFGAKGAQAMQALQAFQQRDQELKALERGVAARGSGRDKERAGSKLGRTGIGGLRDKRSS